MSTSQPKDAIAVVAYSPTWPLLFEDERVRLAGKLVDDATLIAALEKCERVNAGEPITFFEIGTAAAFDLFAQTPVDWLLLEVGLGGRARQQAAGARRGWGLPAPLRRRRRAAGRA